MTRKRRIFDTNVPVIANGDQSPQASAQCQANCMSEIIGALLGETILVLDGGNGERSEILDEYRHNLREAGSGLGDRFLIWLTERVGDERHCILVPITKKKSSYAEFPSDPSLAQFDPADHKWIATACSHRDQHSQAPDIVQAADMKWKGFEVPLRAHGITIDFICDTSEDAVKSTKQKKKPTKKSK